MFCPLKSGDSRELFVGRSARALSPEVESALEHHLASCQECRRVAEAQDRVWSALDAWEAVSVSTGFDQRLYSQIAAEAQRPWWRRALPASFPAAWSWKPTMPVAAACAVLLAAFLFNSPSTEQQTQLIGQPGVQPRVDIEQVERALDDIDMLSKLGLAAQPSQPKGSGRATM